MNSTTLHSPLDATQLASARQALLHLREELLKNAEAHRDGRSRIEAAQAELEQLREDDDAQSDEAREYSQWLTQREQEELQVIEAALARLADGHYGQCVDCDAEIPWSRLQARPEASRCLSCQAQTESKALPHQII